MPSNDATHVYFVAIHREENGQLTECLYGRDLNRIRSSLLKNVQKIDEDGNTPPISTPDAPDKNSLRLVMRRAVDALKSHNDLVPTAQIMRTAMYLMLASEHIADPVEKTCSCIEVIDGTKIYGLSNEGLNGISHGLEKTSLFRQGVNALPSAILMSMVATFDSCIADVARTMLRANSNVLSSGEKTISLSDVLQAKTLDEIKERILDDEIYKLSRGSHEEQVQYIERMFHIEIIKHWKRWPDFIEIFERRNLIAHGEKNFTKRYISICQKSGHKGSDKLLDVPIKLTFPYLYQTNQILLEFAVLLIFSLWRKHVPDEEGTAFSAVNQECYNLIRAKQYVVAIRILEYMHGLKNVNVTEIVRRMIVVNLASAHAHTKSEEQCEKILASLDWSASSDNFKICVAALRKDVDEVCRLMPFVVRMTLVEKENFREWPVFDLIRDDPRFSKAFFDIFGEPITRDLNSGSGETPVADGDTPPERNLLH
jgi:hypothetical protein